MYSKPVYEKFMVGSLTGFRVLFLTNTPQRKESIARFLRTNPSLDFIWITHAEQMFRYGLPSQIWSRGGKNSSMESILGPTFAQELRLPKL